MNVWIQVNYISSWATTIITIIDLLWMVEMIANAIIQSKDLDYYVGKDWKTPLAVMTVLGIIGTAINYVVPLGVFAYAISLFAFGFQLFFTQDYTKTLTQEIEKSWYLRSTYVAMVIEVVTILAVFVLLVTTLATTGLGL